jgi:hypothetical protein
MKLRSCRAVTSTTTILVVVVASLAGAQTARTAPSLRAFRSDAEILRAIRPLAEEYRRREEADTRAAELAELQARAAPACVATVTAARGSTAGSVAIVRGSVRTYGVPLSDARVRVVADSLSALSDSAGTYRIVIPADHLTFPRRVTLVASRLGMLRHQYDVGFIQPGDSIDIGFSLCEPVTKLTSDVFTITDTEDDIGPAVIHRRDEDADEGGVVKFRGDHIIVLRRGRLFTIAVNEPRLRVVSTIDAFPPGVNPETSRQDHLLAFEDKVVVIGGKSGRGGVEISTFRIDDQGQLLYRSTHQIRSRGYSSRWNDYVPRLIGSKLVLYSSIGIESGNVDSLQLLPALRKWDPAAGGGDFRRIVAATRVFSAPLLDPDDGVELTAITTCELATPEMTCEAYAVFGPIGRVFSVSPRALYMWVDTWRPSGPARTQSIVYRLPLDGSPPSALNVTGSPADASSFLETGGYLNVLLRDQPADAPSTEREYRVRLLRIAIRDLGDGASAAPLSAYRELPLPSPPHRDFANHFIGDKLLYGSGTDFGPPRGHESSLFIVPWRGGGVSALRLPLGIDQIAPMGSDAVVLGADSSDLHVFFIRLGRRASVETHVRLRDQALSAMRSYEAAYVPNGRASGVLGLSNGLKRAGYRNAADESASAVFVRIDHGRFVDLGELSSSYAATLVDDQCKTSCPVDWFGNSRPLFYRGRIFALLGYELVEGVETGDGIREVGRVSFAPRFPRR